MARTQANAHQLNHFLSFLLYPLWLLVEGLLMRFALVVFCNFFARAKVWGLIAFKFQELKEPKVNAHD